MGKIKDLISDEQFDEWFDGEHITQKKKVEKLRGDC